MTTTRRRLFVLFLGMLVFQTPSGAFQVGVSTSAFQNEGGQAISEGRGRSIWDDFTMLPNTIYNHETANRSCDFYTYYEIDIQNVCNLNIRNFRFSLSWSRLFPLGYTHTRNEKGFQFYDRVLASLKKCNITPLVTLYHWDLPSQLQHDVSGWMNASMISLFKDYAYHVFDYFGDRVEKWITINEPRTMALMGYGNGLHAPGIKEPARAPYQVAHNLLLAHAEVYKLYHNRFYSKFGGKVSMALNSDFIVPKNKYDPNDLLAASRSMVFEMGWFADVLIFGEYPIEMINALGSRLPTFSADEKKSLRRSLDFFALNHYSSKAAEATVFSSSENVFQDMNAVFSTIPGSVATASSWLNVYPQGMYLMIQWLEGRYRLFREKNKGNIPLIITENGYASNRQDDQNVLSSDGASKGDGFTRDSRRWYYLKDYMDQALKIKNRLNLTLTHYFIWTLNDNFEWQDGYSSEFGIFWVNYSDPNLARTPKKSALLVKTWISQQN